MGDHLRLVDDTASIAGADLESGFGAHLSPDPRVSSSGSARGSGVPTGSMAPPPPPAAGVATAQGGSAAGVPQGFGPGQTPPSLLQQSAHPVALIFHLLFRTLAILAYILGGLFSDSFIMLFVVIMLLLACDFWAVKNITGRLLVGLRWWNEIDEEGNNMWVFEAHPSRVVNQVDSRIFWTTLYVTPAIWVLLGFITLIRLRWSWLLTVAMALSMTSANLVGYSKAHSKQTNNKSGYALPGSGLVQGFVGNLVTSRITGFFGGGNSNNSGGFAGFGR